jgi:hypothetical protein
MNGRSKSNAKIAKMLCNAWKIQDFEHQANNECLESRSSLSPIIDNRALHRY